MSSRSPAVPPRSLLLAAALALSSATPFAQEPAAGARVAPAVASAGPREKAVFGVSGADPQTASLTLANVANALDALGPGGARLEIVAYGPGIVLLRKDSPVAARIADALRAGVRMVACQNSMRATHLEASDLVPGVEQVPSGVVALIRRQHEGYAYIRS